MSFVYDIRLPEKADLDYIRDSWQRTYERSPDFWQPGVIRDEYYRFTHNLLDEIITRCWNAGSLLVASKKGAPHLIVGFICAERDSDGVAFVHWVQVKQRYWKMGVATALIDEFRTRFAIQKDANLLFTFASQVLSKRDAGMKAVTKFNAVYWPWYKFSSQPDNRWYFD